MNTEYEKKAFVGFYEEKVKPFGRELLKNLKTMGDIACDLFPASSAVREKADRVLSKLKLHVSYDIQAVTSLGFASCRWKVLLSIVGFLLCFVFSTGFIGTVITCFLGFLAGLVVGHFLDIYMYPQRFLIFILCHSDKPLAFSYRSSQVSMRSFASAFTNLLGRVAATNGKITPDEMDVFLSFVLPKESEVEKYKKVFSDAFSASGTIRDYTSQIRLILGDNEEIYPLLLDLLFLMASVDDSISRKEFSLLKDISEELEIPNDIFLLVSGGYDIKKAPAKGKVKRSDFEILGVERSATKEEIRRAWILLVQKNHPDRLAASSDDAAKIEEANEVLAEINAAYNRLMKDLTA